MNIIKNARHWFFLKMSALIVLITSAVLVTFWLLSRIWWPEWTGFNAKSLWDVLDLVVVPIALAGGVYWLNRQQKERELKISNDQRKREAEIANNQRKSEAEIAREQREENVLQTYIDRMSDLLLKYHLQGRTSDNIIDVRSIAQARTFTVLRELQSMRKGVLVRFLQESGLIKSDNPIILMKNAYLMKASLSETNLTNANLAGALLMGANLRSADLTGANLTNTNLRRAYLIGAVLNDANLTGADLEGSHMIGVKSNRNTIWPDGFTAPINFNDIKDLSYQEQNVPNLDLIVDLKSNE